jgi:hypothetical protein
VDTTSGERRPRRHGRARERRGLLEREVRGHRHKRLLADDSVLGQPSVEVEHILLADLAQLAAKPRWQERVDDAIADREARDARSDRLDLAGAIRQRDEPRRSRKRKLAAGDHRVAKIERTRTDPDKDLPGLGLGDVLVDEVESVNAGEARMTVGTQLSSFLDCAEVRRCSARCVGWRSLGRWRRASRACR